MKSQLIRLFLTLLFIPSFAHCETFLPSFLPSWQPIAIEASTLEPSQKAKPVKRIAITIDDLPFVGEYRNFHLNKIITTLQEEQVPATGFIIAQEVRPDSWDILRKFRDAGLGLGNHTLSHANLNRVNTETFRREIARADRILKPVLTKPKYFRYPYLAMGTGRKKDNILCYLSQKKYIIAPITIDSKDFAFNQRLMSVEELGRRDYLAELKPFYLDFIWQQTKNAEANQSSEQAQILLIHANLLNAYVLPDIIALYKRKGYTFISLKKALKTFKPIRAQCRPKPQTEEPLFDLNMDEIDKINI